MKNTQKNLVNSVDVKSSARKGLSFTAEQLKQWHWNDGKSMRFIANQHGVSVPAIGYWFQKLHVQHRSNLQEVLFEPSPAMSYVIGCLLGDGCVYNNPARNNSWEIKLQVCDLIFAESFKKSINLLGINCAILHQKSKNENRRDKHLAYSNSNSFGAWWNEIGRGDAAIFAAKFPEHFVRGFYEAEGTIKFHRERLELSMCNTDESLIKCVRQAMPETIKATLLKFGPYSVERKARWDICINNQLDIKRFLAWIMPCFKTQPRGQTNTEPSRDGNSAEGVENTKAIQNGRRVGRREAIRGPAAPSPLQSGKMYSDLSGNRKSAD